MANPYLTINGADLVSMTWQEFNDAFDAIYADIQINVSGLQAHIAAAIAHTAAQISVSPTTGQANTNVQAAIAQLAAQLYQIIAGPAPSAAEVQDARTGADAIARASLGILMREIHAQQLAATPAAVTLSPGLQSITASRRSRIRNIKMSGRTLVNLIGRDGNFESDSNADGVADGWSSAGVGQRSIDATNAKYGLKAQRITALSGDANTVRTVNRPAIPLLSGKYYIMLFDVVTDGAGLAYGALVNGSSTNLANTSQSAANKLHYAKYAPSADIADGRIYLYNASPVGATNWVSFDGVRLYEISAAEYTAIDSMTAAQVATKWPYVDDAKHVNAVYIQNAGKNIRPVFGEWSLHANATVLDPDTMVLAATAAGQSSSVKVTVIPGATYTLSIPALGGALSAVVKVKATTGFYDTNIATPLNSANLTSTFVAPTTQDYVYLFCGCESVGTFTFSKLQLELGSAATTFEPRRGSYLYLPDAQLRSNVDGAVADSLYTDGEGKPRVTRRFREIVLDGTLIWGTTGTFTGYKRVYALQSSNSSIALAKTASFPVVVKYDGKVLAGKNDFSVADSTYIDANSLNITIPSADSGWGDSYTPSAAEIAAYFYGWKMNNGTFGTAYNGSGTKTWTRWDATSNTGAVTTVPTDYAASTYTPYRLIYQLAASVDEALNYEGDLVLHEGGNQIEVGTGIVVREAAKIDIDSNSMANINNGSLNSGSSNLKYRAAKFVNIYGKDGAQDKRWNTNFAITISPSGALAQLPVGLYDTSTTYAATYLALDTYALGIAPQTVTAEYASNQKEALDDVNRGVTDLRTAVSVLQSQKAGKQSTQLIKPTLLNSWVQYADLRYAPLGYYKDDFGFVRVQGMIGGGVVTTGTIIFKLPQAYRPAKSFKLVVSATNAYGEIEVTSDGNVTVASIITNTYVSLDTIVFKAAQ